MQHLKSLVKIFQVGSFTKAAEIQNISLPRLSTQMKSLENRLNARLFDRSTRPPKLTPLGQKIAMKAVEIIDAHNKLEQMCQPTDQLIGHFNIGFITSLSVRILPKLLKSVLNEFPDTSFSFASGLSRELMEDVRSGKLDAAIVTKVPQMQDDLDCYPVLNENMVVAMPKSYFPLSLRDLTNELPFLHFMPQSGIGILIENYFKMMRFKPLRSIVLDNIEATMNCVNEGLGFTVLPEPEVTRYCGHYTKISMIKGFERSVIMLTTSKNHRSNWVEILYNRVSNSF